VIRRFTETHDKVVINAVIGKVKYWEPSYRFGDKSGVGNQTPDKSSLRKSFDLPTIRPRAQFFASDGAVSGSGKQQYCYPPAALTFCSRRP
jgi:hypothetical protein